MALFSSTVKGIGNYGVNVGRSLKYAAPQIVRNLLPNAHTLLNSTASRGGREIGAGMVQQARTILKEDVIKVLADGGRNLKHAVKTGRLFEGGPHGDAFGGGDDIFADMDAMLRDAFGDDKAETMLPEVTAAVSAGASAGSAIASSPAFRATAVGAIEGAKMGRANVAATTAMANAMVKATMVGNQYLDSINRFHHTFSRGYYDRMMADNAAVKGLLSDISGKMTSVSQAGAAAAAATDLVTQMMSGSRLGSSFANVFDPQGGIRVNAYTQHLKRRFADFGAGGGAALIARGIASSPVMEGVNHLIEKIIPKGFKANLQRFDQFISHLGAAAMERTGAAAKRLQSSDSWLLQALGAMIGNFTIDETGAQPHFGPGAGPRSVHFDGYTHKTINTVIPTYLSLIHSEMAALRAHMGAKTPSDRAIFDPQRGVFASANATKQATDALTRTRALEAYEPLRREGKLFGQDDSLDAALEHLSRSDFQLSRSDTAAQVRAKLASAFSGLGKGGQAGAQAIMGLDFANPNIRGTIAPGHWRARNVLNSGVQTAINEHGGMNADHNARVTDYAGFSARTGGVGVGELGTMHDRIMQAQGRPNGGSLGVYDEGGLASDRSMPGGVMGIIRNPGLAVVKGLRYMQTTVNRWLFGGTAAASRGLFRNLGHKAGGAVLRMMGVNQKEIDEAGVMGVVKDRLMKGLHAFTTGLLGKKGEDGIRRGGLFSGVYNAGKSWLMGKDGDDGVLGTLKSSVRTKIFDPLKRALVGPEGALTTIKKSFQENFWAPMKELIVGKDGIWPKIRSSFTQLWGDMRMALFGSKGEQPKDPRTAGGVGLGAIIGGLFGGPLGAAVGAGAGSQLPKAMDWMSKKIEKSMAPMKRAIERGAEWLKNRVIEPFSRFLNDPETGLIPKVSRSVSEGFNRFLVGDGTAQNPGFVKKIIEPAARFVRMEIMDPVKRAMHEMWDQSKTFFQDHVIKPLRGTLEPFVVEFKHQMRNLGAFTKNLAKDLYGIVNDTFKDALGKSLTDILKDNVLKPIKDLLGWGRAIISKVLGTAIKFPVNIIRSASQALRRNQLARGAMDGRVADIMGEYGGYEGTVRAARPAAEGGFAEKAAAKMRGARDAVSEATGKAGEAITRAGKAAKGAAASIVTGMPGGGGIEPATSGDVGVLKRTVDRVKTVLEETLSYARGEAKGKRGGKQRAPAQATVEAVEKSATLAEKTLSWFKDNLRDASGWLERIYRQLAGSEGGAGGSTPASGLRKKWGWKDVLKSPFKFSWWLTKLGGKGLKEMVGVLWDPVKQLLGGTIGVAWDMIKAPFKLAAMTVRGTVKAFKMLAPAALGTWRAIKWTGDKLMGFGRKLWDMTKLVGKAGLWLVKGLWNTAGSLGGAVLDGTTRLLFGDSGRGGLGRLARGTMGLLGGLLKIKGGAISGGLRAAGGLFGGAISIMKGILGGGAGALFGSSVQRVYVMGGYLAGTTGGASSYAAAKGSAATGGVVAGAKRGFGIARDGIMDGFGALGSSWDAATNGGWAGFIKRRKEALAEGKAGKWTDRLVKASEGTARGIGIIHRGFSKFWQMMVMMLPAIGSALASVAQFLGITALGKGAMGLLRGSGIAGAAAKAGGMLGGAARLGGSMLGKGLLAGGAIMGADYLIDRNMQEGRGKTLAKAGTSIAGYAATGAALGSVVPVIGTGVGALVGGLGGLVANGSDIYNALAGDTPASRVAARPSAAGPTRAAARPTMDVPARREPDDAPSMPTSAYIEAGGARPGSSSRSERQEELLAKAVSLLETLVANTNPDTHLDVLKKAADAAAEDAEDNQAFTRGPSGPFAAILRRKSAGG